MGSLVSRNAEGGLLVVLEEWVLGGMNLGRVEGADGMGQDLGNTHKM